MIKLRQLFLQILQPLAFLLIFACLQFAWLDLRDGEAGHFLIDQVTVKSAVSLINYISPSIQAYASGTHISAQGGGINVINGCEGVEVMFLLIAALLVSPISIRSKLMGLLIGLPYIFILNQGRLIAMFYAVRTDKVLFNLLHDTVAPILLIAFTMIFYSYWLSRQRMTSYVATD